MLLQTQDINTFESCADCVVCTLRMAAFQCLQITFVQTADASVLQFA